MAILGKRSDAGQSSLGAAQLQFSPNTGTIIEYMTAAKSGWTDRNNGEDFIMGGMHELSVIDRFQVHVIQLRTQDPESSIAKKEDLTMIQRGPDAGSSSNSLAMAT